MLCLVDVGNYHSHYRMKQVNDSSNIICSVVLKLQLYWIYAKITMSMQNYPRKTFLNFFSNTKLQTIKEGKLQESIMIQKVLWIILHLVFNIGENNCTLIANMGRDEPSKLQWFLERLYTEKSIASINTSPFRHVSKAYLVIFINFRRLLLVDFFYFLDWVNGVECWCPDKEVRLLN